MGPRRPRRKSASGVLDGGRRRRTARDSLPHRSRKETGVAREGHPGGSSLARCHPPTMPPLTGSSESREGPFACERARGPASRGSRLAAHPRHLEAPRRRPGANRATLAPTGFRDRPAPRGANRFPLRACPTGESPAAWASPCSIDSWSHLQGTGLRCRCEIRTLPQLESSRPISPPRGSAPLPTPRSATRRSPPDFRCTSRHLRPPAFVW